VPCTTDLISRSWYLVDDINYLRESSPMRILVKNGKVHNGERFVGVCDVLIEHDKIAEVSNLEHVTADKVIDASGCVVAPGFIDVHNHAQPEELDGNEAINLIAQGVTSCVIGNCGNSGVYDAADRFLRQLACLRQARLAINVGSLVGHNTLRNLVLRDVEKPASPDEVDRLCAILDEALERGGLGLSSGLMYSPGIFADPAELEALVAIVGQHDCVYTTHMRDEGDHIVEAVVEALDTAEAGRARLQISHHKVVGLRNQGKTDETIALIDKRRERQEVNVDFYPYTATSTVLRIVIPRDIVQRVHGDYTQMRYDPQDEANIERDGLHTLCPHGWEDIVVVSSEVPGAVGRSVADIAGDDSCYRAVVELIRRDPDTRAVFLEIISELDLQQVARLPYAMIGSDGSVYPPSAGGVTHPRSYGSFARVIREYVCEQSLFSLEELIRRTTALPAETFRIEGRGRLHKGYFADVIIFAPVEVRDHADYEHPRALATGMRSVLVNGTPVYQDGGFQNTFPGRLNT